MKPIRSISIGKLVLSITFFFLLQETAFTQSTFDFVTITPLTVSGNVVSDPGSTYSLARTAQNGFDAFLAYTLGTTSGIMSRSTDAALLNALPPDPDGVDMFTFVFDLFPASVNACPIIHLSRCVGPPAGTSQAADYTLSWGGGALATLNDPDNVFTMPDGTLFPSGTTLIYLPGPANTSNASEQWTIDIPATSASVSCTATQNVCGATKCDMLWTEWISFDATIIDCITLPVELLNFQAKLVDNRWTDLTWDTASEIDNDYFIIERSIDLENWEFVAHVDGIGSSTELLHYSTKDLSPYKDISYYRLTQYDLNGESTSGGIQSVEIGSLENDDLIIYPTTTNGMVSITGNQKQLEEIEIFNSIGQRMDINVISKSGNNLIIDVTTVASGLYLIHSGHTTYRLIKE